MKNEMRLIDANALMAYFEEQYNLAMDDQDPVSAYVASALRCCKEYFKTIPTVDAVEVVHGRWKFNGKTLEYRCQRMIDGVQCNGAMYYPSDYCPDCGAKMDGDN